MISSKDIEVFSGNVVIEQIDKPVFNWEGQFDDDRELLFKSAYEIAHSCIEEGISNLTFRVHHRFFQNLSFLEGEILQEFPRGYGIRRHADGTKFLFSYKEIPTFDSGDREWDSMRHIAVYADEMGINLIHCSHGYAVPRIQVYIGLVKSIPAFNEWLEMLR